MKVGHITVGGGGGGGGWGGGEEGNEERASGLWPMDEKKSGSFFTAPKFARELLGPRHFYKL